MRAIAIVNKIPLFVKGLNYHYVAIVACSVIAHGLLLLNDGVYWDGWLIYSWLVNGDWNTLYSTFSAVGIPLIGYFHWLMGYFPATVFCYKLLAFAAITLSGILVYLICNEFKLTSRLESMFISLIFLSYPAFQASIEISVIPYLVCYLLFFTGCFLALKFENANGIPRHLLRAASLILLALSFTIKSLLVFYCGFLLLMILYIKRKSSLTLKSTFTRYLPRRLDYLLVPVLYWIIAYVFFPPHGAYAEYYHISLSPISTLTIYYDFIMNTIYAQLNTALGKLIAFPALGLMILLLLLWIYTTFIKGTITLSDKMGKRYTMLVYGLFLLVLAIFPYAVTGHIASAYGLNTRHAILISLPVAVILVAITRLCFDHKTILLSKIGPFFLVGLVLAFSLSSVANYLSWQACWVKDQSVMVHLANLKDKSEGISVFWIDDQFRLNNVDGHSHYEWASMFKTVWGGESRIGLDKAFYTPDYLKEGQQSFIKQHNLSEFDPAGCQAVLTIRPGSGSRVSRDNTTLSFWYFIFKYIAQDRLNQFLLGLTDVQIERISAPEALNCPHQ